jgi:hypothetical protein
MKTPLVLLALSTAAVAAPDAPEARMRPTAPLFEVDHLSKAAGMPTYSVRLFAGGRWSENGVDAAGNATPPLSGTLSPAMFAKVQADLAAADWKTVRLGGAHCMAISAAYTVYRVNGQQVYEEHTCSPTPLDDVSAKAVADIDQILDGAIGAAKANGSALLEIDVKPVGSGTGPASTLQIGDRGSWTLATPGATAPTLAGTLAAAEFERFKALLADAKWQTHMVEVRCMMMPVRTITYVVRGTQMFVDEGCSTGKVLDSKTTMDLMEIKKLVGSAIAAEAL